MEEPLWGILLNEYADTFSSLRLFLHSWQLWLQREEPQKVVSLSPGSSAFKYGDVNMDLGRSLAASL